MQSSGATVDSSHHDDVAHSARHVLQVGPGAMTDDDLAREVQRLQQENTSLETQFESAEELHRQLVERVVRLQQAADVEEEAIANNLLRRVDQAKRELRSYKQQIRQEEDTHAELRRQIEQARRDQVSTENMLEQEQELLLNKLQRELVATTVRKSELEKALAEERRQYLELLHQQLAELRASSSSLSGSVVLGNGASISKDLGKSGTPGAQLEGSMSWMSASGAAAPTSNHRPDDGPTSDSSVPRGTGSNSSATGNNSIAPLAGSHTTSSQRTPESGTKHRSRRIADLEEEINHLLLEQADSQRKAAVQAALCADLTEKLNEVQQLSFLDRARLVRLREELDKTKAELEQLESQQSTPQHTAAATLGSSLMGMPTPRTTPSQMSDAEGTFAGGFTPIYPIPSLRDRTKEVLSTPRIVPMVTVRQRGSSVASDPRSLSPSVPSGYNSGAEHVWNDGRGARTREHSAGPSSRADPSANPLAGGAASIAAVVASGRARAGSGASLDRATPQLLSLQSAKGPSSGASSPSTPGQ